VPSWTKRSSDDARAGETIASEAKRPSPTTAPSTAVPSACQRDGMSVVAPSPAPSKFERLALSPRWAMHLAPPIQLYGSGQANAPSRRWNGRGHDTRRAPRRAHSVSPVAPPAWLIGRSNGSVGGSKGIAHSPRRTRRIARWATLPLSRSCGHEAGRPPGRSGCAGYGC
jgi:hypothetical protein